MMTMIKSIMSKVNIKHADVDHDKHDQDFDEKGCPLFHLDQGINIKHGDIYHEKKMMTMMPTSASCPR